MAFWVQRQCRNRQNPGYSNIWRESNQLLHMVTGMEEKLQKKWRKISEIMDALLHIIIQSGRVSNLTSLR